VILPDLEYLHMNGPRHPPRTSRCRSRRAALPELLAKEFPGQRFAGKFHHIEHHLAHLSSAFHVSPFEEAVVASIDGFGDFSSAAWGVAQGTDIKIDGRVHFPHSLGIFYQALTQYLGFPHYGDEYKVMGSHPMACPRACTKCARSCACIMATSSISNISAITGLARRSRSSAMLGGLVTR
jgi:carbamoyltransferase